MSHKSFPSNQIIEIVCRRDGVESSLQHRNTKNATRFASAGMVDVKNKRCEAEGCMKRGLFGFDGERARFCGGHRLEGDKVVTIHKTASCY